MDTTIDPNNMPHVSDASVSVEIETEDMTLNIGPQHPSTHGVLRLVAKVDGEKVSSVENDIFINYTTLSLLRRELYRECTFSIENVYYL